jgi:beta-glucosidase
LYSFVPAASGNSGSSAAPVNPAPDIYRHSWIDFNKNGLKDPYEDPSVDPDIRLQNLLSQMTLEEKTCQLATLYGSGRVLEDPLPRANWQQAVWKDGIGNIDEEHNGIGTFGAQYAFPYATHVDAKHAIQRWFVEQTRLGIPVDFTNEGIRGLCHERATYFPAQIGQGSTWNRQLIARIAHVEACEADALGYTNIYSPILDIAQDPRWGRVVECYGEDPYLVGELGKQMVHGLQQQRIVSTPKHFAVYSVPVGGRDGYTRTDPHVAPREVRSLYIEPFRKAIQEAGAIGVMSSYNDYDGIPIAGNPAFLTDILRGEWGFRGYVVSDSESIEYLHFKHKVVHTYEEAVAQAVNAGLNVHTDFVLPENYIFPLRRAIAQGLISQATIDRLVADVLRVKFWLGLFDDPYRGDPQQAQRLVHSPEHQAVALDAARQSLVLLKNDNNSLPWSKGLKRVAVIGPNANEREQLICRYGPSNAPLKTVYQGICEALPHAAVTYSKGCDIIDPHFPWSEILPFEKTADEQEALDAAVATALEADAVVLVLGGSERTVRESRSRTDLNLPGRQEELLRAIQAIGKPIVLVLIDGRPVTINYADKHIPAILHAWFPGEFCGQAVAEALFGDYNPGGKLPVTFPRSVGQLPYAFPFKPGAEAQTSTGVHGALYPFGHGLSYTTFAFSGLAITPGEQGPLGNVEVSCKVKNTGTCQGDEVVQLYLNDEVSSVTTYVQRLCGFERVSLKPGEEKTVRFPLTPREMGVWDRDMNFVVEPGMFKVSVGSSSKDIHLTGKFSIR